MAFSPMLKFMWQSQFPYSGTKTDTTGSAQKLSCFKSHHVDLPDSRLRGRAGGCQVLVGVVAILKAAPIRNGGASGRWIELFPITRSIRGSVRGVWRSVGIRWKCKRMSRRRPLGPKRTCFDNLTYTRQIAISAHGALRVACRLEDLAHATDVEVVCTPQTQKIRAAVTTHGNGTSGGGWSNGHLGLCRPLGHLWDFHIFPEIFVWLVRSVCKFVGHLHSRAIFSVSVKRVAERLEEPEDAESSIGDDERLGELRVEEREVLLLPFQRACSHREWLVQSVWW